MILKVNNVNNLATGNNSTGGIIFMHISLTIKTCKNKFKIMIINQCLKKLIFALGIASFLFNSAIAINNTSSK